jgi:hypothetical protein
VSLDRIELLCGKRPEFYQVDITDEDGLEQVFKANPNIDSVIHFAALKVVPPSILQLGYADPLGCWRIFRETPRILSRQCRRNDHSLAVHAET